jgi:hypothetical protein
LQQRGVHGARCLPGQQAQCVQRLLDLPVVSRQLAARLIELRARLVHVELRGQSVLLAMLAEVEARSTPISRTVTKHPGNVGGAANTMTSSASPSSARVPGMEPKSCGNTKPADRIRQ